MFKKWWTNADGKTGAQGMFAARGFLREYEIEVRAGGKNENGARESFEGWREGRGGGKSRSLSYGDAHGVAFEWFVVSV